MYVRFDISAGKISGDLGIRRYDVYDLPDGRSLFTVVAQNRLNIILTSAPGRPVGRNRRRSEISVFDMPLAIDYEDFLALVFQVVDYDTDYCVWEVEAWSGDGKRRVGTMAYDGHAVTFDGRPIETADARALYDTILKTKKGR